MVLSAALVLWLASGTQREKPVLSDARTQKVAPVEAAYAASPDDPVKLRDLAQAYLDAQSPGMAVASVERAPARLRDDARVQHVYARALIDQGRAADALAAEQKVLASCDTEGCDAWLFASATRRTEILQQLVQLGIEDAQAHPEASAIAYHNATRQARLILQ